MLHLMMKMDWWTVMITVAGGKKGYDGMKSKISKIQEIYVFREKRIDDSIHR